MLARIFLPSFVTITVARMVSDEMEICMLCHTPSNSCYRNFSLDKTRPIKGKKNSNLNFSLIFFYIPCYYMESKLNEMTKGIKVRRTAIHKVNKYM